MTEVSPEDELFHRWITRSFLDSNMEFLSQKVIDTLHPWKHYVTRSPAAHKGVPEKADLSKSMPETSFLELSAAVSAVQTYKSYYKANGVPEEHEVDSDPVSRKVKKLFEEHLTLHHGSVVGSHQIIDDLGADSLDTIELVMIMEEEFDIDLFEDELDDIETVNDAIRLVNKSIKEQL